MKRYGYRFLLLVTLACCHGSVCTQTLRDVTAKDSAFFRTAEARRIGEQLLLCQRVTGGWPKNTDMVRPLSAAERAALAEARLRRDDSTIDNGATTRQMTFLARLYQALRREGGVEDDAELALRCREGFRAGMRYLLSGQYENGGWPQCWPEGKGYHVQITYNDGAMVNTLRLLRDVAQQHEPYGGDLTTDSLRHCAQVAFAKGIDCILATQIRVHGEPTVWCQQHDRVTLAPTRGRSYELPSFCSAESVGIVELLMEMASPDARIRAAIAGALRWFQAHRIMGFRYVRVQPGSADVSSAGDEGGDSRLVADSTAGPLWARFYDLERGEPFVCDRDGIPRRSLEELGRERRNGYEWYNTRAAALLK